MKEEERSIWPQIVTYTDAHPQGGEWADTVDPENLVNLLEKLDCRLNRLERACKSILESE